MATTADAHSRAIEAAWKGYLSGEYAFATPEREQDNPRKLDPAFPQAWKSLNRGK